MSKSKPCEKCAGIGEVYISAGYKGAKMTCPTCEGTGKYIDPREVALRNAAREVNHTSKEVWTAKERYKKACEVYKKAYVEATGREWEPNLLRSLVGPDGEIPTA